MTALLTLVADRWGWTGLKPEAVTAVSRFGHVVVRDGAGAFWYLDPEMATLDRVAPDEAGLAAFWADPEVEEVWRAEALVAMAREALGEAGEGRCYGWKTSPVLGGRLEAANLCVLPIGEVVGFSGQLAEQIRDLPDGSEVVLSVVP